MVLTDSNNAAAASDNHSVEGNGVFLLSSSRLWRVTSGRLGIFAVGWQNGEPVGERRYLWTVEAGDLMIGTAARSCNLALVAVAFELSQVEPVAKEETVDLPLLRQIERWVNPLTQVKGFPGESIADASDALGKVVLQPAEAYSPKAPTVWVKPVTNQACWLDVEQFVLPPSSLFPISRTTWLRAHGEPVDLQILSTEQLCANIS